MARNKAENYRMMNELANLYNDGRTKLEICKILELKNARFNTLFVEAQACGLLQFDTTRPESHYLGRTLLEAIKKKLNAPDDAILLVDTYDDHSILISLADES